VFALAATVVVTGVGAGIDLMRIYNSQQKASQVAALACQYAGRPSVIATETSGTNGGSTYSGMVTTYIANTWTSQAVGYAQTTATPFTATPGGAANVTVTSNVPTTFMKIAGYATIPIAATSHCYDSPSTIPAVVPVAGVNLVQEGFEASPCGTPALCFVAPNGSYSTIAPLNAGASSFPSSPTFTGQNGSKWYVVGYCAEFDQAGLISASDPEGSHSAELDCDNGVGTKGNSSISTSVYMAAGNYELRWFYRSRVDYPNYDPAYICGSSVADTSWANDLTTGTGWAFTAVGAQSSRTNQINVYLDTPNASGNPPLHSTLDGTQQLAGSALIDECVYSPVWIERSVRIKITTAGTYWLSFAADGANDSFGGQVDNIRLCEGSCTGSPQDNFPSASYNPWYPGGANNTATSATLPDWLNPNGANKGLFTENFESPTYITTNLTYNWNTTASLNSSNGTAGTTSSGWPSQATSGWATAPLNQIEMILYPDYEIKHYPALGSQYPDLWGQYSLSGNSGYERLISRPFLLVPGFYNVSYYYMSNFTLTGVATPYCLAWTGTAGPTAASLNAIYYYTPSVNQASTAGTYFVTSTNSGSQPAGINTVGAFISNAQISSTPIGGGGTYSTTSYTNPDSNLSDTPPVTTTSTTPTKPPDAISSGSYTPSTTTALLDICAYSPTPAARSINFQIQKSGLYWLTFSTRIAPSAFSNAGGAIDDVVLTALGSPAMTSPPANYVPVPVGAPQPSSLQYATGYFTVADPPTYPAPAQ
jgi:hypothetical protein